MKKVVIAELFDETEELNTSLRELTDFELVAVSYTHLTLPTKDSV